MEVTQIPQEEFLDILSDRLTRCAEFAGAILQVSSDYQILLHSDTEYQGMPKFEAKIGYDGDDLHAEIEINILDPSDLRHFIRIYELVSSYSTDVTLRVLPVNDDTSFNNMVTNYAYSRMERCVRSAAEIRGEEVHEDLLRDDGKIVSGSLSSDTVEAWFTSSGHLEAIIHTSAMQPIPNIIERTYGIKK